MIRNILFIAACVLLFNACNKIEIPEPEETEFSEPVFNLAINVGGMELPFTAGENCIKLDTDYDQDHLDIYSFIGTYKHDFDCDAETEPMALKFEIRDSKFRNDISAISEDAIREGVYDYFDGYEKLLSYQVMIQNFDFIGFGDVEITTSNGENIEAEKDVVNVELSSDEEWIQMEHNAINNESIFSRKIYLRELPSKFFAGEVLMYPDTGGMESIVISLQTDSSIPDQNFTYLWDDGSQENFINVFLGEDSERRCVQVFDQFGLLYEDCFSISFNNILPLYALSSSTFFSIPNIGLSEELETVIVEYTNSDGEFYTSEGVNENSNFEILDKQPFDANEAGLESSKLEIKFDCILESPITGERLEITNTTGTTAVSYPN